MQTYPTSRSTSMEALSAASPLRESYLEDTYPNGGYYQSPFGRTRYWIVGPETGQKVVLIHGISIPSIVWQNICDVLISGGCRVLLYDAYGRGYSEAPTLPSDPNLYVMQLALLLQYVRWDQANIVGFASGGAIAAAFAAICPHLIKSVALVAASGMMPMNAPAPATSIELPPLVVKLRDLQAANLPHFSDVIASTRKDGLFTGLTWAYETLGKTSIPCMIIHGTNDQVIPISHAEKAKKIIPEAEFVVVEGGSHFLPMEEGSWQQISKRLVASLAST